VATWFPVATANQTETCKAFRVSLGHLVVEEDGTCLNLHHIRPSSQLRGGKLTFDERVVVLRVNVPYLLDSGWRQEHG